MSFLFATPESVTAAASQITTIGSALEQANTAVKASTTAVVAAGADEVSTAIATLMSTHGQAYQTASAQVSQFHNQFIQLLNASAGSILRNRRSRQRQSTTGGRARTAGGNQCADEHAAGAPADR